MSLFNAIQNRVLNNILSSQNGREQLQSANSYEFLFEEIQNAAFGDIAELSDFQEYQINQIINNIISQAKQGGLLQENRGLNISELDFMMADDVFGLGEMAKPQRKSGRNNFLNDIDTLRNLWANNRNAAPARRNSDNSSNNSNLSINNDGLNRIRTLKSQASAETAETPAFQGTAEPIQEQTTADPLEGKTPEEKKTILEQTAQSQRDNISAVQNGSNAAVQSAEQNMQNAETNMNAAIDRDTNINEEVKTQIKESEAAITAKSGEVSSKEAEIAQTDASITETQNTISNLQNSLNSLPSPSGAEEDKEKDAKLAARKSELQSQIAAKQAELTQLQAQKQQQETEKAQLETEKGQLETTKDQIMAEELKDASPATKAAIKAYETSRTNVETTKTNELKKAQDDLNETIQKLSEVEAEIEQGKNNKANTNFDINGLIEAFKQGQIGDCWFLSSLESLSNSEEGQKLLKDAIQINDDGSYTVKFNGVDWAINITDADLRAARNSGQYSNGDDDVLLMEVAAQNFLTQARNGQVALSENQNIILSNTINEGDNPLTSGTQRAALQLFTDASKTNISSDIDNFLDNMQKNGDSTFAAVSFYAGNTTLNTLNTGSVVTGADAYSGHAWSVKSVNGNQVTLINPWNSEQEIVTTRDELKRNNADIYYQDLAA